LWQQLCAKRDSAAFVSFDMDRLKYINDTYGHQAGDYAIRLTANAIRRSAPKEAILARVGGDEFLAVLPRANQQAADRFIKDFQRELKLLNKQEDRAFDVEASCAAAVFRLDSYSTIEECVQKSDEAMYQVKEKHHKHRKD
jgi:diguanylate cyclase (GGDEF)-like protein